MKLLIVEDNHGLSERMQEKLLALYTLDSVGSAEEALALVQKTDYAVIVLDLGLPGMSGLEACKRLRALGLETPILILTGDARPDMVVTLLDAGADDYLTKPFNSDELRARVGALLRRQAHSTVTPLRVGDLILDPSRHEVRRAGKVIVLRKKEFNILEYLTMNKGRVVTRQMILDNAWSGDTHSWRSTVDVHIKNLRDKIDRPFGHALIHTAHGIGYKVEDPKDNL